MSVSSPAHGATGAESGVVMLLPKTCTPAVAPGPGKAAHATYIGALGLWAQSYATGSAVKANRRRHGKQKNEDVRLARCTACQPIIKHA